MTTEMKKQKIATVDEVAKVLGIKPDFLEAAELSPKELSNIVADDRRKRGFFITSGIAIAGAAVTGGLGYLSGPQFGTPSPFYFPAAVGLISAAYLLVNSLPYLSPRAEITDRAQANTLKAYNALKAATPNPSP